MTDGPMCLEQPCYMTAGYYIGGNLHVCWFHSISIPRMLDLVMGKPLVGLVPAQPTETETAR